MTDSTRRIACPICAKKVSLEPRSPWFPFCSQECKMIDLGRWIDQRYAVDMRTGVLSLVEDEEAQDASDERDEPTIH